MADFADFFLYVLVSVITPGPNTVMSMKNGAKCGFVKGLPFNLGIYTGFTGIMALCLLFSRTVYRVIPQIRPVMLGVGCVYMLYQAYRCWTSTGQSDAEAQKGSYAEGLVLQFVNVKAMIFGITALSNYVIPVYSSIGVQLLMCLALSTIAFLCGLLWSAAGAGMSRLFVRHHRLMNGVMAALLVYCAWKLVW